MAIRFYVLPKIGDGLTLQTAFRPTYVSDGGIVGGFSSMDYGDENLLLVAADVTPAEHTAIAAHADVLAVPANLSNTVSAGAVTTIQDRLEAANLPADWVTSALTYRQVLKTVVALVLIGQRYHGLFGRLWQSGVTLDTRLDQLSAPMQEQLTAMAHSLNRDPSWLPPMTLRRALKVFADQLPAIGFAGEKF